MNIKLIKGEQTLEYEASLFFYEGNKINLQLTEPKVHVQPVKTIYTMIVYDNAGTLIQTIENVLYESYRITIDEAKVDGLTIPLSFANNNFSFTVIL